MYFLGIDASLSSFIFATGRVRVGGGLVRVREKWVRASALQGRVEEQDRKQSTEIWNALKRASCVGGCRCNENEMSGPGPGTSGAVLAGQTVMLGY